MTELPTSLVKEVQAAMSADAARKLLGIASVLGDDLTVVIDRAAEQARTSLAGRKGGTQ